MKKIASDIYVSTEYPGVNVGCIVLQGGAIAVDAPTLPQNARAWRKQVMDVAGGPIFYVVLTDTHPDRLLSARLLGAPIVTTREAYEHAVSYTDGLWRSVVDGWSRRYPDLVEDMGHGAVRLPEIMFSESLVLNKGGRLLVERIAGGAPGSARVYLRERNILFVGDTIVMNTHPFVADTPDTKAWLDTLKSMRRTSYAETTIVPGRGPLCDQSATKPLSDYLAVARRRARSLRLAGRARVDRAAVVAELLPLFPVPDDERDVVQRRIKAGMDRLCEELEEGAEGDNK